MGMHVLYGFYINIEILFCVKMEDEKEISKGIFCNAAYQIQTFSCLYSSQHCLHLKEIQ